MFIFISNETVHVGSELMSSVRTIEILFNRQNQFHLYFLRITKLVSRMWNNSFLLLALVITNRSDVYTFTSCSSYVSYQPYTVWKYNLFISFFCSFCARVIIQLDQTCIRCKYLPHTVYRPISWVIR